MASSSGRVDIMPENGTFTRIVLFFGMISTLTPEVWIGMSMMLSEIFIVVYYKVSEPSKSTGVFVLMFKLCS